MQPPAIGVIGTGAMGLGIVRSLVRAGFDVRVRDIRNEAESAAVAAGASARYTPAALARDCGIVILVVVDQRQVETVLFGADGALLAMQPGNVVIACFTVAPQYTAALAPRLATLGVRLLDAPVSGGPQRAAEGTMTIMVAGDAATLLDCEPVLAAISGKRFVVGSCPGDAARFKILNNQLAAVNLAAGA